MEKIFKNSKIVFDNTKSKDNTTNLSERHFNR